MAGHCVGQIVLESPPKPEPSPCKSVSSSGSLKLQGDDDTRAWALLTASTLGGFGTMGSLGAQTAGALPSRRTGILHERSQTPRAGAMSLGQECLDGDRDEASSQDGGSASSSSTRSRGRAVAGMAQGSDAPIFSPKTARAARGTPKAGDLLKVANARAAAFAAAAEEAEVSSVFRSRSKDYICYM